MARNISPRRTLSPPPLSVPLPDAVGIKDQAVDSALRAVVQQLNAVSNYVRQQVTTPSLPPPKGPGGPGPSTGGGGIGSPIIKSGGGTTHIVEFFADSSGPKIELYRVFRVRAGTRLTPTDPGPDTAICIGTVTPSRVEDGELHRHTEREFPVIDLDPADPARYKYWVTSVDDRQIESAFVEATGGPIETVLNGPGDQSPEIKYTPFNKLVNPNFENARVTTANITVESNLLVASSTNATPIEITTTAAHGLTTGDRVAVSEHATNTSANGWWVVGSTPSTTRFTMTGSVGIAVGGATGAVWPAGLSPEPFNIGLDPDFPFSTMPTAIVCHPWSNASGTKADAQWVSNGTRRTNEIILKNPTTAAPSQTSVSQSFGVRSVNLGMHVTLSFFAKATGAPTDADLVVKFGSLGGTWPIQVFTVPTSALTMTYHRFAFNMALPATIGELGYALFVQIWNLRNSDGIGTGTDIKIARAMLNIGDQAAAWTAMPDTSDYLSDTGTDFTQPSFSRTPDMYIARIGVAYA